MSRTIRTRKHRNMVWDDHAHYTATGPEATCKPGCGICGKDERKRELRRIRRNERNDIAERLA